MTHRTQVLFLTNSEFGQANPILAVSHELLVRGNVDVHIASFSPLEKRVAQLRDGDFGVYPTDASSITFHMVSGESMHEARRTKFNITSIDHRPGVRAATTMYKKLSLLSATRTPEEYMQGYTEIKDIITQVNPDVIISEDYFVQGRDACVALKKDHMMISPGTFREHPSNLESAWTKLTKYPAKGSGFAYPLRRRQIPANIYLNLRLAAIIFRARDTKPVLNARKAAGLTHRFPGFVPYEQDIKYMFPATPESDFPCHLPPNYVCCGPLVVPSAPLATIDPDLDTWLTKRPTVLMNLGSFLTTDESHAQELAKGIRILLEHNQNVQVLLKIKSDEAVFEGVLKTLSDHIQTSQVKVEKWLKAHPSEIVKRDSIVCSVHHGGASSYFEAISAGVPQIVLPCWWDTYEFARRVEYLGIGIYGSHKSKSAPKADGIELGEALIALTDDKDERAKQIREKAKELAAVCNAYGGRRKAADTILEYVAKGNSNGDKGGNGKAQVEVNSKAK